MKYRVKITELDGSTPRFTCQARHEAYDSHRLFATYGEANRWAIEHASIEIDHVTSVHRVDTDRVLTAYVSLSGLKWGKVAMVDGACDVVPSELSALARATLEWFRGHYAKVG